MKTAPAAIMIFICSSLAACAPLVWTKPGATTVDFNKDKYSCSRDSMTAAPNVAINTNCNQWTGTCAVQDFNQGNRNQLFNDCMVSKGWALQQQQDQSTVRPPLEAGSGRQQCWVEQNHMFMLGPCN